MPPGPAPPQNHRRRLQGETTAAPAPSPKRTAVDRSSQSRMRGDGLGAHHQHLLVEAAGHRAGGHGQRVDEAGAAGRDIAGAGVGAPALVGDARSRRRHHLVGRDGGGDDQVDVFAGGNPRRLERLRAATMPRSDELRPASATRRSLMPVRCLIHSSEVSRPAARSSLVTTFVGHIGAKAGDGDRSPQEGNGSARRHGLGLGDREGQSAAADEIGADEGLALRPCPRRPGSW